MDEAERSFEELSDADLRHLARCALARLDAVFDNAPVASQYRNRLLVMALCQGSAQHYIDGRRGIKDLDVWAFFGAGPTKPFPSRVVWHADFGSSHLGRSPDDDGYVGRRIDIMGRSIPVSDDESPEEAVRRWLAAGGASARHLFQTPIIALFPERLFKLHVHSGASRTVAARNEGSAEIR